MSISFNSIPVTIRTPGQFSEFSSERAVAGTPEVPHIALAVGQLLAAGTVAKSIPTLVPSGDLADTYFGRGSYLANMCRAFKAINSETELWAIGIDDAAGTAAVQTITIGGTATEDGTLVVYVEGRRIELAISNTDAANDIATALKALLDLETDLSVTFAVAAPVITVTARQKGTIGSQIDYQHSYAAGESLPAGVTCAFAETVPGATDPSYADAIAAMGDVQYKTIICGLADDTNMDLMETELEDRWGPMLQTEGGAFVGYVGTAGATTTYGNARNSKQTCAIAAGVSPAPAYLWAALIAGIDAKQSDPARPRTTIAITPAVTRNFAPKPADRFTRAERDTALSDGMSTHVVDSSGIVRIERLISTYQTNAGGTADTAYMNWTTVRTLPWLRYSQNTRIAQRFPRHKLADDGTRFAPGQAVVTPALIRAELLALFTEWEAAGLVEGWEQFKDDLLVERNASDTNRVDVRMSPDLMNQFYVFASQIQFIL